MSEETYGLEEEILHGNSKKQTIPAGATFFLFLTEYSSIYGNELNNL